MKTYICILLTVAAMTLLCAIAASLIVDPYRIVHPLIGEFVFEPNSRVSKVTFLSDNCSQYDSYFVGDSRSMPLSERDLGSIQGRGFYNFAMPADDIESIVNRLKFMIKKDCPISAIVVGESLDVFMDEIKKGTDSLLYSENPAVSGENRMAFYSKYFLSAQALITYFREMHQKSSPYDIYYLDGHADYLFAMEDGAGFALPWCEARKLGTAYEKVLSGKLLGYREIAEMADQYHFKVIVWIAPLNKWESSLFDDPIVDAFLQQLRAIPHLSVVDADRRSPLLSDFHYWHDCRHFRRTVFDQLVAPTVSEYLGRSGARVISSITEKTSEPK
jgi:hypothetical protein